MLGQEGGQAKIASAWPPAFNTLSGLCLTPGSAMTANDVQALLLQQLAADTPSRRRSLPPSLPVLLSQWVNQRWRERPRCPALRVTPGRRGGVVHAIAGRAACRCLCAEVVQEERAACVPVLVATFAGRSGARAKQKPVRGQFSCSRQKRHASESRSRHRTIARFMMAPCSASSMLFAALRPGRRPGLRALTTPPRGTFRQLRDGRQAVDQSKGLTRESRRRMLTSSSVPLGTPSVRRHGQRSAHPAVAHRARYRAQLLNIAARCTTTDSGSSARRLSCEPRCLSRRIILRIVCREEAAFPAALHCPGLTERNRRSNHSRSSPRGA
jgi:hypothetical protein